MLTRLRQTDNPKSKCLQSRLLPVQRHKNVKINAVSNNVFFVCQIRLFYTFCDSRHTNLKIELSTCISIHAVGQLRRGNLLWRLNWDFIGQCCITISLLAIKATHLVLAMTFIHSPAKLIKNGPLYAALYCTFMTMCNLGYHTLRQVTPTRIQGYYSVCV